MARSVLLAALILMLAVYGPAAPAAIGGFADIAAEFAHRSTARAEAARETYDIDCPESLIALAALSADGETFEGARIALSSDIVIDGRLSPIGGPEAMFAGEFDGRGHAISGIVIAGGDFCGLFGYVAPGGVVRDLALRDVLVSGARYAGAIAGYNAGRVENCAVDGASRVKNTARAEYGAATGGIVGVNTGAVVGCRYEGATVDGWHNVGGVAGLCAGGRVRASASSADVLARGAGRACVGGVVGTLRGDGAVEFCLSGGSARADDGVYAGGIVGAAYSGKVRHCLSRVEATASDFAGGVLGYASPEAAVFNCRYALFEPPRPALGGGRPEAATAEITRAR